MDFEHDVGEVMVVKAIGMRGMVDSMCVDSLGQTYRVVYWNDGNRCTQWMYAWEIEASR